jgi:adenylate kinase
LNLVLFGPPGAGKGTQSQLISEKFDLKHVSTGDLLRAAMKAQTPLGIEAQGFVNKGSLVPDSVVIGLIRELKASIGKRGMLLDGFPRTTTQAEALDELLRGTGAQVDRAVFLEVSPDLLKDRLTGRRICTTCGATFHVKLKPPQKNMICDNCGGRLEQRADDRAEVIENRLTVYEKNTAPLKSYYKDAGKFVTVDGVGEPTAVFARISDAVKS